MSYRLIWTPRSHGEQHSSQGYAHTEIVDTLDDVLQAIRDTLQIDKDHNYWSTVTIDWPQPERFKNRDD